MIPDSEQPPPRTIVPSGATLSRIDIGLSIASVAHSCWDEIERRAGMLIRIAAWGPVMADERLVAHLLHEIVFYLLQRVPEGEQKEHVIELTAGVGREDTLLVELRHVRRGGLRSDSPLEGAHDPLLAWDRAAMQFAGRVELVKDPKAERCYRLTLRLANAAAQRS